MSLASQHCPVAQVEERVGELRRLMNRVLTLYNELAWAREGKVPPDTPQT